MVVSCGVWYWCGSVRLFGDREADSEEASAPISIDPCIEAWREDEVTLMVSSFRTTSEYFPEPANANVSLDWWRVEGSD